MIITRSTQGGLNQENDSRYVLVVMCWWVCVGSYVLVGMCWQVCVGRYVLVGMCWQLCVGRYVLEGMCWQFCVGRYLLVVMCWQVCIRRNALQVCIGRYVLLHWSDFNLLKHVAVISWGLYSIYLHYTTQLTHRTVDKWLHHYSLK